MSTSRVLVPNISEQEAALYDRQIRLWGLDAQKRLRAAKVLVVGLSGLGAEVAKNVVLSGVKSLTLLDQSQVTEKEFSCQFLVSREDVGKNRAESSLYRTQLLNPMVEITADSSDISSKDESFFDSFDVICLTSCTSSELKRINSICHKKNKMFFAGDVFGFYSYMFSDLNEHDFAEDIKKTKTEEVEKGSGEPITKKARIEMETVTVKSTCTFKRFEESLEVQWGDPKMEKKIKRTPKTYFLIRVLMEFLERFGRYPCPSRIEHDKLLLNRLREDVLLSMNVEVDLVPADFTEHCFGELSPVCAVVGGILGQEIIKAVSKKNRPHNNFFFYNGVTGEGMVDCIG